jgi:hypothetical protein
VDYILIDGDQVLFQPTFGAATVVVLPGSLRGSGAASLHGRKLCVAGDEASVSVKGCVYLAPPFVIPGSGCLEIASLGGDQQASSTKTGGKPPLLVGKTFTARFRVDSPAQQPTAAGPVADATPTYAGTGSFLTSNRILRAS